MKKENAKLYIVVGAILATTIIAYSLNPAAFQVLYNEAQQGAVITDDGIDISQSFHNIIDKYAPNYIQDRRVDCVAVDGTWNDQEDKIGCFDIPAGSWDSSNCASYTIRYLQDICNTINGNWVCTANNVGCSR